MKQLPERDVAVLAALAGRTIAAGAAELNVTAARMAQLRRQALYRWHLIRRGQADTPSRFYYDERFGS